MRVLMGETSPVGVQSAGIPAPLAFLRGVLCLNSNYRPVGHCSKLPAYGYAQHPYAEGPGPFWIPPLDPHHDDVTISEKIAWSNPRVVSFDQYLLRSDRPAGAAGFQTGLETNGGVAKPSLAGFRLPLVVTRTHTGVSFWGLVRPAGDSAAASTTPATGATGATGTTGATGASGSTSGPTTVALQYSSNGGKTWRTLRSFHTRSTGTWSAAGRFASHRLWRTKWVTPGGVTYFGAPTRAYTVAGKVDY